MRDYIGTFWCTRYRYFDVQEYVVVSTCGFGFILLELETSTFHPAKIFSGSDVLQVFRHFKGAYFDNFTLEPIEPLKSLQIKPL